MRDTALFIGTIISVGAASATLAWFLAAQFTATRKLMHDGFKRYSRRLHRVELYLANKSDGFVMPELDD